MKNHFVLLKYCTHFSLVFLSFFIVDLAHADAGFLPILSGWEEKDSDITRFVSRYTPLSNTGYIPSDLRSISGVYIDEAGRHSELRRDATYTLTQLAEAFYRKFGVPLTVVSGYRSAAYQQRLWDLGRCTDALCAPPGYSEHQLGLAVDLFDASTDEIFMKNGSYARYITWLRANAHRYGWHESYQKGESIDAYEREPWHWRYLGVELATRLKRLDMSYTQYVRLEKVLKFWKQY